MAGEPARESARRQREKADRLLPLGGALGEGRRGRIGHGCGARRAATGGWTVFHGWLPSGPDMPRHERGRRRWRWSKRRGLVPLVLAAGVLILIRPASDLYDDLFGPRSIGPEEEPCVGAACEQR